MRNNRQRSRGHWFFSFIFIFVAVILLQFALPGSSQATINFGPFGNDQNDWVQKNFNVCDFKEPYPPVDPFYMSNTDYILEIAITAGTNILRFPNGTTAGYVQVSSSFSYNWSTGEIVYGVCLPDVGFSVRSEGKAPGIYQAKFKVIRVWTSSQNQARSIGEEFDINVEISPPEPEISLSDEQHAWMATPLNPNPQRTMFMENTGGAQSVNFSFDNSHFEVVDTGRSDELEDGDVFPANTTKSITIRYNCPPQQLGTGYSETGTLDLNFETVTQSLAIAAQAVPVREALGFVPEDGAAPEPLQVIEGSLNSAWQEIQDVDYRGDNAQFDSFKSIDPRQLLNEGASFSGSMLYFEYTPSETRGEHYFDLRADVLFNDGSTVDDLVLFSIKGLTRLRPKLAFEEQEGGSIAFLNQTLHSTCTVTNTGAETIMLTGATIVDDPEEDGIDDAYYTLDPNSSGPVELGPGESHEFYIDYLSDVLDTHGVLLQFECEYDGISYDGSKWPYLTVTALKKSTVGPPVADLKAASLDLFAVEGQSQEALCALRNNGAYPITITNVSLEAPNVGFTIDNTDDIINRTLPGGEAFDLDIAYSGDFGQHSTGLTLDYTYCGASGTKTFDGLFQAETITANDFAAAPLTYMGKNGYLDETDICPETDEIVELANRLNNDPLAIYNWVYENIAFIEYEGLRMGAQSTLMSRHGNSWDTSALLAALLRQAGVPARFVSRKMNRLGRELDVAYVEAWLMMDNYRNGSHGGSMGEWVPLAPWFKTYDIQLGMDLFPNGAIPAELNFDFDSYVAGDKQMTAIELYENDLQEYIKNIGLNASNPETASLQNVSFKKRVIKKPSSILPASLPDGLSLTGESTVFSAVPEDQQVSAVLTFKNRENQQELLERSVYLFEIAGKRLYLDFDPEVNAADDTVNYYTPRLKLGNLYDDTVNDSVLSEGLRIFPQEHYTVNISYEIYNYADGVYKTKTMERPGDQAGAFAYIALDCLPVSVENMEKLKKELAAISLEAYSEDESRGRYLGIMSEILAENFYYRFMDAFNRALSYTSSKAVWNSLSPVLIYTHPFDMGPADAESKFLIHPNWDIDAWTHISDFFRGDYNDNTLNFTREPFDHDLFVLCRKLAGYTASYNEAAIFEDWQDTRALSTVKGLMWADDNGINVHTLDRNDITEDGDGNKHIPALEQAQVDDPLSEEHIATVIRSLQLKNDDDIFLLDNLQVPEEVIRFEDGISGIVMLGFGSEAEAYLFSMNKDEAETPSEPTNGGLASSQLSALNNFHLINPDEFTFLDDTVYGDDIGEAGNYVAGETLASSFNNLKSIIGDPVDLLTGEYYQEEHPDFAIAARGPTKALDLKLTRTYFSRMAYNGPFGYGWSWNHDDRLVFLETDEDEDGTIDKHEILYYHGEGVPYLIEIMADGSYELPSGTLFTLEAAGDGYIVHHKDTGLTLTFDSQGKLLRKSDRFGNYLRFVYTAQDRLSYIKDALGRSLTFTYNENGKVARVTDFAGHFCQYYYGQTVVDGQAGVGDADDLTAFVDQAGNITRYEYLQDQDNPSNDHNMSKYILPEDDSSGNDGSGYLKIGYYKNDQVSYHENETGAVFNFQYSRINRYAETWNEEGYYRKVFFDENNNEIRVDNEDGTVVEKTYDGYHNMISKIDANGHETVYQYYPDGGNPALAAQRKLYKKTGPSGAVWTYAYDKPDDPGSRLYYYSPTTITEPHVEGTDGSIAPVTEFVYNDDGSLRKKIQAPGYRVNTSGNVTAADYGEIVADQSVDGIVTEYSYDNYGNITAIIDPKGHSEQRAYDDQHLHLTTVTDRRGQSMAIVHYVGGETGPLSGLPQPIGYVKAKTDPLGNTVTYEYNQYGQKIYETNALGEVTEFVYNVNRKLVKTIGPDGAVTEKIYNSARDIVAGADVIEEIDPLGNSVHYEYDLTGHVIEKQDKNGNVYRFVYDGMGRVVEKIDPHDNAIYYTYDGNGNLLSETDRRGHTTTRTYDAANRLLTETDPLGNQTIYWYDDFGNKTCEYMVDAEGNADFATEYRYDRLGRLKSKIIAPGSADERTYTYRYDAHDNLIKETTPKGHYTVYEYDENGNKLAKISYDVAGNKLAETRFDYDERGLLIAQRQVTDSTNPDSGNETRFEYDALGRKTSVIDALGNPVRYAYDAAGNRVSETDRRGGVFLHEYDHAGRLIKDVDPLGNITTYRYDANGNRVSVTDAMGNQTRTYYDDLNRKIGRIAANGDETTFDYDANGNQVYVTDPRGNSVATQYDALNRPVAEIDDLGNAVVREYDHKGRVTVKEKQDAGGATITRTEKAYDDPSGQVTEVVRGAHDSSVATTTSYTYDANGSLASDVNGEGITTLYGYDGLDRKVSLTEDYLGADAATTEYGYNFAGNLVYITDARNHTLFYQYDELNRRIMETDAYSGAQPANPDNIAYGSYDDPAQNVTYDANGNVDLVTKRDNTAIDYAYDALNRKVSVTVGSRLEQEFEYDKLSRLTQSWDYNRGTATHSVAYGYDQLSRVISETQDGRTVGRAYDGAGNLAELGYPSQVDPVARYYDAANRLSAIDRGNEILATVDGYTANRVSAMTLGNNFMTLSLDHDALLRETSREYEDSSSSLLYSHVAAGDGGTVPAYDANSNLRREVIDYHGQAGSALEGAMARSYTYDNRDRLTDVGSDLLWRYDATGNWVETNQNGEGEGRTANADHEYTAIDYDTSADVTPTYDANGNLTYDGLNTYAYDWADRLVEVHQGATLIVSYEYDAANRRVQKTVSGTETVYVYDGGQVIEEYVGGVWKRLYVYGLYVDDPLLMEATGGGRYYYIKDRQFSVRALAQVGTGVVEYYDYTPFGQMTVYDNTGTEISGPAIGNPYGYTGRRFDAETGLWHYRNRMYSADLGRFLQRDPAGYVDGLNLYAYVRNNPLLFVDPDGLRARFSFPQVDESLGRMDDIVADVLNDPVNLIDPLGLWGVNVGGTLMGADFSTTIYDSDKGWFPSTDTDIGVSTTAFGGGISITFDDPCGSSIGNDSDLMVSWGLSKYLGISYSPDFAKKSVNIGLGLGLPVSFGSSVENFAKGAAKGAEGVAKGVSNAINSIIK